MKTKVIALLLCASLSSTVKGQNKESCVYQVSFEKLTWLVCIDCDRVDTFALLDQNGDYSRDSIIHYAGCDTVTKNGTFHVDSSELAEFLTSYFTISDFNSQQELRIISYSIKAVGAGVCPTYIAAGQGASLDSVAQVNFRNVFHHDPSIALTFKIDFLDSKNELKHWSTNYASVVFRN